MFKLFWRNLALAYQASHWCVITMLVNNVVYVVVDLSSLLVFARIIDLLIAYVTHPTGSLVSQVWWLFGLMVVRWIILNLSNNYQDYLNNVYAPVISNHVDNIITQKLDVLSPSTIESSDFQDRMNNIHTFSKAKFLDNVQQLNRLVNNAARFVYALIALAINSPALVVLILAVSLPEVYYNLELVKKMRELNEQLTRQRREQGYFTALTQDVTAYFNLKSYNLFPYFLDKIKHRQQEIFDGSYKIQRHNKPRAVAVGTIANLIGQFIPKGYYIWLALTKRVTVGQLQLFFQMIDQLYNGSYQLLSSYLQISENNIYVADLFALIDLPEGQKLPTVPGLDLDAVTLEFKDVSFSYPNSKRQVLKDVSFVVRPGERLALVGRNGAGKTTITKLLNKFYEPTKGTILVNGVDLRSVDGDAWRRQVSNLSQDVARYFLTVRDNVYLGDLEKDFDESRYRAGIKRAQLEADIAALPKTDGTMLGKHFANGVDLSGGQWQKLSLARSFYRDAPLLIMDEPTSAIDAKAEQAIMASLFTGESTQTQIIVSHRFSNIKQADQILVLDHGKIIERGTHRQLMGQNGTYTSLYTLQSAAYQETPDPPTPLPA